MFENYFFTLGIINNLLLISVFLSVKMFKESFVKKIGVVYLLLIIPSIYGIIMAIQQNKQYQYSVFLGIFIAFLILEGTYDFILKVPFRKNWKLLVPFLVLYWSMNYGFIVMAWQNSLAQGAIVFGLFLIQLSANLLSHTKKRLIK
ncbi:MAG: hypothetical protein K9L02_04435 [Acholeplasmataceae bacterium]|nr:hypothetical protein [Acholeplasmataceae bacterium]